MDLPPSPARRACGTGLFLLVALLSVTNSVLAQQVDQFPPAAGIAGSASSAASESEPIAPEYHDYFRALGYSFTRGLLARDHLIPIALGTAGSIAFVPFDHDVSDRVRGKANFLGEGGEVVAHSITLTAVSGGLMLGSLATHRPRFRAYSFTLSQGLIVATTLTSIIKPVVGRRRPDGQNHYSFPSGHAAGSFALATVTTHYYGAKAGIPLYTLGALVVASRVSRGKHFPSDVVSGATIGYLSARAAISGTRHVRAARQGEKSGSGRRRELSVAPVIPVGGGTGVAVSVTF